MPRRSRRVGVVNFEPTCRQWLREYGIEARIALNDVLPEAAKTAAKMIRAGSKKRTGKYAKDWTYKRQYFRGIGSSYVVYNKNHYRLAHLLENPHDIKNQYGDTGADWAGDHVIYDAQLYVMEWLVDELAKRLGDIP